MAPSEIPCLNLAISPLKTAGHFAVHVTRSPYPGGYDGFHECIWTDLLTQRWQAWQEMFSTRVLPNVPFVSEVNVLLPDSGAPDPLLSNPGQPISLASRLMQDLGISLWRWLFENSIKTSFDQSQGMAMGQNKQLRLRLEIRDPDLIALPWEIMQDEAGKQAISLSQNLLFSRTTSDVDTLPVLRVDYGLKILLVLGQDSEPRGGSTNSGMTLKLQQEAIALADVLRISSSTAIRNQLNQTPCQVDTLMQPTPAELIRALETQPYNVFFYSGHGAPAPDGGLLFLRPDQTLNGTELAQVLTRCQVKLAVFNACWGAQPDHYDHQNRGPLVPGTKLSTAIPRSSLAEVLIHHGVPSVLGMRDSITDEEALSFIKAFARALGGRMPVDQAVAVARQHLLTLYRFNQQAWTLPVLYMHPQFDGELLKPKDLSQTKLPGPVTDIGGQQAPHAFLRSLKNPNKVWYIQDGMMRVGIDRAENDLVLQENGVSRRHAVIFCRYTEGEQGAVPTYVLKDFSRYGTRLLTTEGWNNIHQEEVSLKSGDQLKFGSSQNEPFEFLIHEVSS
jgi:hypothetical protein